MAQAEEKKQYNQQLEETPSMEEILNSIRGVISEDENQDDDILELTEIVNEDIYANSNKLEEPQLEKSILDDIDEALAIAENKIDHKADINNAAINIDTGNNCNQSVTKSNILLSEETIKQSSIPLKTLVKNVNDKGVEAVYTRHGTSLEDLVVEAIKPFLAEWLNKNLPSIVKKVVEKEVKRIIPKEEDDD